MGPKKEKEYTGAKLFTVPFASSLAVFAEHANSTDIIRFCRARGVQVSTRAAKAYKKQIDEQAEKIPNVWLVSAISEDMFKVYADLFKIQDQINLTYEELDKLKRLRGQKLFIEVVADNISELRELEASGVSTQPPAIAPQETPKNAKKDPKKQVVSTEADLLRVLEESYNGKLGVLKGLFEMIYNIRRFSVENYYPMIADLLKQTFYRNFLVSLQRILAVHAQPAVAGPIMKEMQQAVLDQMRGLQDLVKEAEGQRRVDAPKVALKQAEQIDDLPDTKGKT